MITQPLLIELVDSGKITVLKDKPNSRNHRLVFNGENEFNRLDGEIAQDDRQALYHQLPNLLLASHRLNRIILPGIKSDYRDVDNIKRRLTS